MEHLTVEELDKWLDEQFKRINVKLKSIFENEKD
jgi:hypothetical protein